MIGLLEAQIGLEQRDKERALRGLDIFSQCSLTLIELETLMDEAERWDTYEYFQDEV